MKKRKTTAQKSVMKKRKTTAQKLEAIKQGTELTVCPEALLNDPVPWIGTDEKLVLEIARHLHALRSSSCVISYAAVEEASRIYNTKGFLGALDELMRLEKLCEDKGLFP